MARKFSKNELGVEAETYVKDVKKLNEIDIKADIILLWGLSTPHFSLGIWQRSTLLLP